MVSPIGFRVAQIITENAVSAPPVLGGEAGDDPFKPIKPKKPPAPPKKKPQVEDPKDPKDGTKVPPKVDPPQPPVTPPRTAETPKCSADGKPIHVTVFTADMAAARDQRRVFDHAKAAGGEKLGRDVYAETYEWIGKNLTALTKAKITPPEGIADRLKNGTDSSIADRSFVARAFAHVLNTDKASFNKVVTEAVKALADDKNPAITKQTLTDTLTARWTPYGPRTGVDDPVQFVTKLGELKGATAAKQAAAVKNITAADKKFFAPLNVTDLAPVLVAENAPERYRRAMADELVRALDCEAARISKAKDLSGPDAYTPAKLLDDVQGNAKISEAERISLAPSVRDGKPMGLLAQGEAKLLELAQQLNRGVDADIVKQGTEPSMVGGVVSNTTGLVNGKFYDKLLILPELTFKINDLFTLKATSQWFVRHLKGSDYRNEGLIVTETESKTHALMIENSVTGEFTLRDNKEDPTTKDGPSKYTLGVSVGALDLDGRVGLPKKYLAMSNDTFGNRYNLSLAAKLTFGMREEAFGLDSWLAYGFISDFDSSLSDTFGDDEGKRDFNINIVPRAYLLDGALTLGLGFHYKNVHGGEGPSSDMVVLMPHVTGKASPGGVGIDYTVASYHALYPSDDAEHSDNAIYADFGVSPVAGLRVFGTGVYAFDKIPGKKPIGVGAGSHSNRPGQSVMSMSADDTEIVGGASYAFGDDLSLGLWAGATRSRAGEGDRTGSSGWNPTVQFNLTWFLGGLNIK